MANDVDVTQRFRCPKEAMKTKKPKRKLQDLGGDENLGPRFPDKVFVPVTRECITKVLSLLDRFGKEQRCVGIVFNSCFHHDEAPFDKITEKFEPIFGKITPEQVFIRVDMPMLASTPEEAYELKFKSLNQAYIIADFGCTENDLNRKAAARQVFCCPMTIGCIRKNVKEGLYLMHRSVVLGAGYPKADCRSAIEDSRWRDSEHLLTQLQSKVKPKSKNKSESAPIVTNQTSEKQQPVKSSRKRDRIVAAFISSDQLCPKNIRKSFLSSADCSKEKQESVEELTDETLWKSMINRQDSIKDLVDETLWKSISSQDNVVLKIRNSPLKDSVNAFNLMMGTTSIKSQQIIAKKRIVNGKTEVMDVMIALKSDSPDLATLMNKNGLKTALGIKLRVERFHPPRRLRRFLTNLEDRISLDNGEKLPIKSIGYGNNCQ